MDTTALKGLVIINGKDIWTEFGAFLTEEKKGGRDNLTSIMAPSKVKSHVGVNIGEHGGTKYSADKIPLVHHIPQNRGKRMAFGAVAGTRADHAYVLC